MAQLNVYLTFNGNCREAMEFYYSCIGGTIDIKSFGEMPGGHAADSEKNLIMHSVLTNGDFLLMASDTTSEHGKVTTGNSVTLSLNCTSELEIDHAFARLSVGGQVTMPLSDQFWGAKFGMLTDKFGMPWMMNYDRQPK